MLWSRINQNTNGLKPATSIGNNNPVLNEEEIGTVLQSQGSLEEYARRPDCFRKIAGTIRAQCRELDMNQDERVNAISMTLCELATAKHHSTPLECVPFTLDSITSGASPNLRSQGECVDALSRSAQFWSSYSGYLREVTQLCFAFRRWHDIDAAKEIYKNITLEKASLVHFLHMREKAIEMSMHNWEARFLQMQEAALRTQSVTDNIGNNAHKLQLLLVEEFNNVSELFQTTISDLQHHAINRQFELLHQMKISLAEISQHHSQELGYMIPSLEKSLISHVESIFSRSQVQSRISNDLTEYVHQKWRDLSGEISDLTQSLAVLSADASGITHALNKSIQQAHTLHLTNHEATLSATNLVDMISHLTATTQTELQKINNSATFILEQTLRFRESGFSQLLYYGLTQTINFFLRDPTLFGYVNNVAICRIFSALSGFTEYLCRAMLSGFTTVFIIIFSYKKYIARFTHQVTIPNLSLQETSRLIPYVVSSPRSLQYTMASQASTNHRVRRYQRPHVSRIPERLCQLET